MFAYSDIYRGRQFAVEHHEREAAPPGVFPLGPLEASRPDLGPGITIGRTWTVSPLRPSGRVGLTRVFTERGDSGDRSRARARRRCRRRISRPGIGTSAARARAWGCDSLREDGEELLTTNDLL